MNIAWQCPQCGRIGKFPDHVPRVRCACGYSQTGVAPGLGDYVAAGLSKVGITSKRYSKAKKALGLRGSCNCLARQAKLNKLWRRKR